MEVFGEFLKLKKWCRCERRRTTRTGEKEVWNSLEKG